MQPAFAPDAEEARLFLEWMTTSEFANLFANLLPGFFPLNQQAPEIESVFVMASPKYAFLSSSWVKELARFDGKIDGLVPGPVVTALTERNAEFRDQD